MFLTAVFLTAVSFAALSFAALSFAALSFAAVFFAAPARVLFVPAAPSASPPGAAASPEAAAPLGRPVAGCCTAVLFATMAAAPSHIVILLANRVLGR
ncbi:hypothetical protein ACIHEJ_12840 [Streptomyces sp. NPDC052301]|uniref:hypothetical protein n=1 Tax=Streptomyces sp. NPDC052301 TaxID=3365687 RepID=UPI0037D34DE0